MRRLRGPFALVALLGLLVPSACSLLLETSTSQCSTDDDCQSRGGDFASSVCTSGRCVAPVTMPMNPGCNTNAECIQMLGGPAICRQRDRKCAALLSTECTKVFGDVTSDDTIVLGTMFTTTGTNGPSGIARQRSAELALNEIKQSVGGIPTGAGGRPHPLAIVECDDTLQPEKAAMHLATDVAVPAIIGAASSTEVIDVATMVTIPGGVLLISPAATSAAITSLNDDNLVWRTSPSDVLQAVALVDQLSATEAAYRTANTVPVTGKVNATFLYINESYGLGLYGSVTGSGTLNGKPLGDVANAGLVSSLTYPSSPADLEQQIQSVLAQSPRPAIIVAFGSTEVITKFVGPLESRWGATAPRPRYVFSDAVQKTELLDLVATNDDLRKRIRGSVPAASASSPNFESFVFKYQGMFGAPVPSAFGMAGAYDSMFLLAYSIAAAGPRAISGDELQKGFGHLVSGTVIDVGGTNMSSGFRALMSPGTFDFEGASGPLDFDLTTGEARSNIDVWCIAKDGTGRPAFVSSQRLFDAKSNTMAGKFNDVTCLDRPTD